MSLAIPLNKACAELGVSRTTGYALIKQGMLIAKKIGSHTYIDRLSLEKFWASRATLPSVMTDEECQ